MKENIYSEKREKLYNEALTRMKMLKLSSKCINAFKHNEIWLSEGYGALYELNVEEKEIIDEFRRNNPDCLVYHVIHNNFDFGNCYTILFVSCYEDEWESEKEDIQNGIIFAYVRNMTVDYCSEFGTVAVKSNIGGLVRVS